MQKHIVDLGEADEGGSDEQFSQEKMLNTAGSSSLADIIRTIKFEQQHQRTQT